MPTKKCLWYPLQHVGVSMVFVFQLIPDIAADTCLSVVKVRTSGLSDLNFSGIASQRDYDFKVMFVCESSSFIEKALPNPL